MRCAIPWPASQAGAAMPSCVLGPRRSSSPERRAPASVRGRGPHKRIGIPLSRIQGRPGIRNAVGLRETSDHGLSNPSCVCAGSAVSLDRMTIGRASGRTPERLHVVHVPGSIPAKYGAGERFLAAVARECAARGHRFTCIWGSPPQDQGVLARLACGRECRTPWAYSGWLHECGGVAPTSFKPGCTTRISSAGSRRSWRGASPSPGAFTTAPWTAAVPNS